MNCRVIAVFLLALVVPAGALAEPGVFSKRGLQNDRALAKARDRLHIVYATAAWCGPCQRMKQETWVNPLVEAWIGEHAVMTAVDIDEYPKFREQNGIRGIPALILMDGTTEVARFSGYKTAAETLSWLERNRRRAESGSGNASQAARTGAERTATPQRARTNLSPMQRWEQADALMKAGRTETATRMLIDLWTTPLDERDSAMENVRVVFTRFSIEKLVGQHELAHRAFSKVRDHTLRRLHAGEQDPVRYQPGVLL
ncbi:MAG: thioredoxin family protein, partial [Planctomycetota bacterium]